MSYEAAPQTRLLATHCAVCRRPLCDSKSVEMGVGPDCRKRAHLDAPALDEHRARANHLIYEVACRGHNDVVWLAATCTELTLLGFGRLAELVMDRVATLRIRTVPGEPRFALDAPYDREFVAALRSIRGRRWGGKEAKSTNTFPLAARPALWALIQRHFRGAVGIGPKGVFQVPAPAATPASRYHTDPVYRAQVDAEEDEKEHYKANLIGADEPESSWYHNGTHP
jgi:hypothetical protein